MISKEIFLAALEEVDNAILAALPAPKDCSFQFSKRFEQKMRSVIRRGNHPVIYKALQRVACVLLVLLMLFSTVMIFSTDARAAVIGWIKEQYDTFYHYFFPSETTSSKKAEYTLGWIPDEYTLVNSFSSPIMETRVYIHPTGNMIQFTYQQGSTITTAYFDAESYTQHSVTIGNSKAEVYISSTQENTNSIVWSDLDNGILFSISAPLSETELIKIAENIQKNKS